MGRLPVDCPPPAHRARQNSVGADTLRNCTKPFAKCLQTPCQFPSRHPRSNDPSRHDLNANVTSSLWKPMNLQHCNNRTEKLPVSIIVPVLNEEMNLPDCLRS